MADPNIGQVVATVWESVVGDKPTDAIFNSRALLFALKGEGYQEEVSGGRLFELPIEYAENTNFRQYGELETLDTVRVDTFDAARYDQKINAGTVVISKLEEIRNTPTGRKLDVIAAKLDNGKNSATATMNRNLWTGDGSGNNFDGITRIISSTPTTGIVGGIDRSLWSFHRSRQVSGAHTTQPFDNLAAALRSCYNLCSLGGVEMTPTAVICDRATLEGYESTLVQIERLVRDDGKAAAGDSGFLNDAIKFKAAGMFYDEDAVPGEARMLNPKALKFMYLQGAWLKMEPPVDPSNQLVNVTKVFTFGNLGTGGSRYLGVVTGIN